MSRQYIGAAKALKAVSAGSSLKAYCAKTKVGKLEYALCCETLKYQSTIQQIMQDSGISAEKMDVDTFVLEVMIYELLFGQKKITGGGVVKRRIMEYLDTLKEMLSKHMTTNHVINKNDLIPDHIREAGKLPKYIRINEIKMNIESGQEILFDRFSKNCIRDQHIPSLYSLPMGVCCHGDLDIIKSGQFIIQDKASCMPSQILMDSWSGAGDIIDACAAPGNKTTHMAALLHMKLAEMAEASDKVAANRSSDVTQARECRIFAYDKSPPRALLLTSRVQQAGADRLITVQNKDFLQLDPSSSELKGVTAILLDPSCSGSGVVRAIERVVERDQRSGKESTVVEDKERVRRLQAFQITALKKAFSFPNADVVVYSTCSIHQEENEDVVAEVLRNNSDWDLARPARMESWPRRGNAHTSLTESQSSCLIRCHPSDGMNGFFVALFMKQQQCTSAFEANMSTTSSIETATSQLCAVNSPGDVMNCRLKRKKGRLVSPCICCSRPVWNPVSKRFRLG